MEDYKVDFVVDKGMFAQTINVPLKRFTLVGATTRAGSLSAPLRNRFGLSYHLEFYTVDDLRKIIRRSAEFSRLSLMNPAVRKSPAAPVARRGLPIACSAGFATTPMSKPTAPSIPASRSMH